MRILKCILTISPVLFRAHSMPHSPQIRNYETENSMFEHLTRNELNEKHAENGGNVTQSQWIQITIESHLTRTVTELDMNTHKWGWVIWVHEGKISHTLKLHKISVKTTKLFKVMTHQKICHSALGHISFTKNTVLYHNTIWDTLLYIHTVPWYKNAFYGIFMYL